MTGKPKRPSTANRNGSRLLVLAAAAFAALCLLASSAFASKEVRDYFGGSGNLGGAFANLSGPRDIAVNSSGVGPANPGDVYVADPGNNRVQRFASNGSFVSAWGADVVRAGGTGDQGDASAKKFEICTVASECKAGIASSGNGTASGNGSLNSPQAIAVDPDTGNVYVSDPGNNRVNTYDGAGAFIRSFGWDVVKPGDPGDAPGVNEVQTITLDPGVDGSFWLIFGNAGTGAVPVDASAATVQSALEGLNAIDSGDVSVGGAAGAPGR